MSSSFPSYRFRLKRDLKTNAEYSDNPGEYLTFKQGSILDVSYVGRITDVSEEWFMPLEDVEESMPLDLTDGETWEKIESQDELDSVW